MEILRQPAKTVGMVLAPTYPMLRDSTCRSFLDLARRGGVLASFSKAEMHVTLIDGKHILFRSADDPDRLRGPNLSWFYLDEAALMHADIWPIMIGRLRVSPARAWATSTPRGFNWLYDTFTNGGPDYAIIRSSTRDNTFLPADFVRSLEHSYDSQWQAQEVEGEFVDLGAIDHFLPDIALWRVGCLDAALPPLDAHTPCVLALDAGESNDTFAVVAVSAWQDGLAVRYSRAYVPQQGVPLDFDAIERDVRDLVARYAVQELTYDPFLLGQFIRRLTTHDPVGTVCTPFPQGAARLESDKGLYDLITTRRLLHDGQQHALSEHIANADKKLDASGRMRIVKRAYRLKIDLAVALGMACQRAGDVLLRTRTLIQSTNPLADWRG